jgi:hypothetical protein
MSYELDSEYQDGVIEEVREESKGHYVVKVDGWSLGWACDFEPQVGDRARYFGKGIGYTVRGIVCFPKQGGMPLVVRYQSPEEAEIERKAWLANCEKERAERVQRPRVKLESRVYDSEMGEISGFGGGYEETCRRMALTGMKWLDDNPSADPKFHGYRGITGVISEDNDDAKALTAAVLAASGGDCTGAMHQAAINHALAYKRLGWDGYRAEMLKREEEPA